MVFGIFYHFLARDVRIGLTGACEEQTQKVVNFGSGAHGGTWIFIGGFLLDGDYRAKSRDFIHIGTFHFSKEAAGVGRESFYVTPLSFGKDGVEREGRFSAAAQSGNYRERIAGNGYIYILEVVYACAVHFYIFCFGSHFFVKINPAKIRKTGIISKSLPLVAH